MKLILRFPLVFSCLVIGIGLIFSPNKVDPFSLSKHLFLILIVAVSFAILFLLAKKNQWDRINLSDRTLAILVVLIAFLPRLASIYLLDIKPESDFGEINRLAIAWASNQYTPVLSISTYPIYSNSSVIIFGLVYKIFGPHILAVKFFNTFCAVLTTLLLFLSGKKAFGRTVGIAAALIFALFPTAIFYVNILSSEHIYILFSTLFMFLYIHTLFMPGPDQAKRAVFRFLWYLLLGGVTALNEAFRPFGAINLIAMAISDFILLPKPYVSKHNLYRLAAVMVAVLAYLGMRQVSIQVYEHMNQTQYIDMKFTNLLIGMNYNSGGQFNPEDWQYANQVLAGVQNNQNEFDRIMLDSVKQRLIHHVRRMWVLLFEKIKITWSADLGMTSATTGTNVLDVYTIRRYAYTANRYYFSVVVLLMLASVKATLQKVTSQKAFLFSTLCILGFVLLQFLSEVQDRYAIVLLPFFSVLAALGSVSLLKMLWRTVKIRSRQQTGHT